jgi:hypothetical protein
LRRRRHGDRDLIALIPHVCSASAAANEGLADRPGNQRDDGFNLLNADASQIDYYYTSRLPGEPAAGIDEVHFHPLEPRSFRLSLTKQW